MSGPEAEALMSAPGRPTGLRRFLPPIGSTGCHLLLGGVAIFILGPLGGHLGGGILGGYIGGVTALKVPAAANLAVFPPPPLAPASTDCCRRCSDGSQN